jgi:hypothetical protein
MLLMLAEQLLSVQGLRIVQLNTDGITVVVPVGKREQVDAISAAWSKLTRMKLEAVQYQRMWIRDVNNYIAEKTDGGRKYKGVYQAEREWHQNQSMTVVRKAAEAAMCNGASVEAFIAAHDDPWDFLMRLDLTRASHLVLDNGERHHGVIRYYVSPEGHSAVKVMPKTRTRIHGRGHAECEGKRGAWTCTACGEVSRTKAEWEAHADEKHASKLKLVQKFDGQPVDFDMRFYAGEARKLIIVEDGT